MPLRDVLKSIVVLLVATLIGCGFDALGFTESNIIAVYILGVLVTAVITTNRLVRDSDLGCQCAGFQFLFYHSETDIPF